MILANKLCNFEKTMEKVCYDGNDPCPGTDFHCDPRFAKHSMWVARNAALYVELPPWFLNGLKKAFPCSCAVFRGMEEVWQMAISHEESRGNIQEGEDLRMRLRGYWDRDLWEAVERACGGDPEALAFCRNRFEKLQTSGGRTSPPRQRLTYFEEFMDIVDDRLLVALAKEGLRVKALLKGGEECFPF
jgi:hypothetical protein